MTELTFRSDVKIDYIQHMGSDEFIGRAARASLNRDMIDQGDVTGLLNYLTKAVHSSPFEHQVMTVRVEAPIFVTREWERHRTQSYSEMSMRFAEASPEFYVPPVDRPLINSGSGAHPKLVAGSPEHYDLAEFDHTEAYKSSWKSYESMIKGGIASEVARNVLPVGVYTNFWATANLNNWYKFLFLRNGDFGAPQEEIVWGAKQVELLVEEHYPIAYKAWKKVQRIQQILQQYYPEALEQWQREQVELEAAK